MLAHSVQKESNGTAFPNTLMVVDGHDPEGIDALMFANASTIGALLITLI
jgi:hypothetical protein